MKKEYVFSWAENTEGKMVHVDSVSRGLRWNVLARIAMKNYLPDMVMKENMDLPIIVIPEEPVLKYVTWLYCINWQTNYTNEEADSCAVLLWYI